MHVPKGQGMEDGVDEGKEEEGASGGSLRASMGSRPVPSSSTKPRTSEAPPLSPPEATATPCEQTVYFILCLNYIN
jgi:hypothetical protein